MSAEIKKRRPRKKRWRRLPEGELYRGTYIVPNLFTTANLFSGFFGIVSAINGHFVLAALAILASCVFDILDGKVARLTRATSRFGVEYDSLADLVAFGVGPGLLMYLWALKPYGRLGWLAAFVLVACGALRLARFNVQTDTSVSKKYFVGLPIPGAAGMTATTVLFFETWKLATHTTLAGISLLVATYMLGFLMVSTFPYNSFKDFEIVKAKPLPVLSVVIVLVTVVAVNPGLMLFVLGVIYVVSGPVRYAVWWYRGMGTFREESVVEVPEARSEKSEAEGVEEQPRT
jgi:CDP-diacylglycerol--serine O-phosphatidyltransferase